MLKDSNNSVFILRKTKSFNKSRYSRNRQYYRTGVFLCLWANIILVTGGYYFFYRLTIKFSYVWPIMTSLFVLVFVSYFSKNYVYGLYKLLINLINNLSFILIIYIRKSLLIIRFVSNTLPVKICQSLKSLLLNQRKRLIDKFNTSYTDNEEVYELLFLLILAIV